MKKSIVILFVFLSLNCLGQQTPEKIAADKLSAIEYLNNQIQWTKEYFKAEITSVREAVDKVEKTNTAYRETQNEWRGQMKDQQNTFVTRAELWSSLIAIVGL